MCAQRLYKIRGDIGLRSLDTVVQPILLSYKSHCCICFSILSCPHSHENSQTSPHNSCTKITALVITVPQGIHYKIVSLTNNNLQTSQPSYIRQLVTIQPSRSTRSKDAHHYYISLYRPPVSSSLKFCNRSIAYAAPALWNGLPKDLLQFW